MFKVVIVDDEALVRVGLKSIIEWEKQNCEIIGEASNGQAGFELILDIKPDIVITDIKMPVMDGLEMLEKLIAEGIKSKFIILSSYDEFSLARKAMKYGVEEYIIKLELEEEALIKLLNRIKSEIVKDNIKLNENYKVEKYIRSNQYSLREEFFKKLISKVFSEEEEIREELRYMNININEENIVCAGIQIRNPGKFRNYEEADMNLLEFSILNIVEEISNDFFQSYCFKWTSKEYFIIFSYEDSFDDTSVKEKIINMGHRLATMLKQYFNAEVIIAISNLNKGINNISTACMQSLKNLQNSFYINNEKVIFCDELFFLPENSENVNMSEIDNLIKYIEMNDIEAIQIVFENIINKINKGRLSKERTYDICAKIAYVIAIAVEENEKSVMQIFGDNKSIFDKIIKLGSVEEINDMLRAIEKGICDFILIKDSNQNNKIISKAKKYIEENITKSINLQDIAKILNISSGYLSTIFKQYAGVNFIDYVTEIKIEKAKKLLKDSNYKIYQIAEMTGYENAYYFSKVFKKVTGITPREYLMK